MRALRLAVQTVKVGLHRRSGKKTGPRRSPHRQRNYLFWATEDVNTAPTLIIFIEKITFLPFIGSDL